MQNKKRITLKDIAAYTGITVNSVSRALRDCDDISESTKETVRKAAKELGYVHDILAGSLRSGFTKTIAVIIGDIANPVFGLAVRSIENAANKLNYSVIIYNTDENSKRERDAILNAYSKRVDGVLLCPVPGNLDNIQLLQKIGIPYVLMGRYCMDFPADAVIWDEIKGGEIATQYFIERGHSHILYIGGPVQISCAVERLQGYRNAHAKVGLPINEKLIRSTNSINSSCGKEIGAVLREGSPFTAAVIFSDLMAYGALYEFKKRGIQIPVSAFDNIQAKIKYPFSFPSVGSYQEQGAVGVDLLFQKIHEPSSAPTLIKLDVYLANTADRKVRPRYRRSARETIPEQP